MSLPKVVSQDTFDQIVLENVVEFDKPIEEAIKEATDELLAQVRLILIVLIMTIYIIIKV